jgi:hypothetical protein
MEPKILKVEFFQCIVKDQPGEAYQILSHMKSLGVNLLAFNVVPIGAETAQLIMFPERPQQFSVIAEKAGLHLTGPKRAFIVQGDDELGAFAEIHRRLFEGDVNVDSSAGVIDGRGGYGYVIYVRATDYNKAAEVLGV